MISTEIFKRVRRIEITARRMVNEIFAGQYASTFKGRGMEFSEVREYLPGDDVRDMDWNVTARTGLPHVKKFIEERELTVIFVLDSSSSQWFGSKGELKSERAAEIAAVLAFSALRNNDKVGMILFSEQVEKFIPPRKTRGHALRLIREILSFRPSGRGTSIRQALDYLNRVQRRRAVVFLISDFIDSDYEDALRITLKKHDTILVPISDSWERALPKGIRFMLEDAEDGTLALVRKKNSLDFLRTEEEKKSDLLGSQRQKELEQKFHRMGADTIFVETGISYVESFLKFFKARAHRLH